MKVNVPLAITSNQIIDIFNQISKSQSFEIIENDQNGAMSVHKGGQSTISRMLTNCYSLTGYVSGQSQEEGSAVEGGHGSVAPTMSVVRL